MKLLRSKKGLGIIAFVLVLMVIFMAMLANLTLRFQDINVARERLMTRIEFWQATIQLSQIIRRAYDLGQYPGLPPGSCPVALGVFNPVVVGANTLCLPTTAAGLCVDSQFCIRAPVGIAAIDHLSPPSPEPRPTFPMFWDWSFWPKATAQVPEPYLPPAPALPGSTIDEPLCNAGNPTLCTRCIDPGKNADCFVVDICLNYSMACNPADRSEFIQVRFAYKISD